MDTNIFNIFLYNILSRCFATYSVIPGYLLTSFSHNFFGSINTVIVIARYYMIECSSTQRCSLEVLVLVSRCLEDMKNGLGLGLEIKVLVLVLVLKKKSWSWSWSWWKSLNIFKTLMNNNTNRIISNPHFSAYCRCLIPCIHPTDTWWKWGRNTLAHCEG